jgi:hypothetical protein
MLVSFSFLFCHAYRGAIVLTMAGNQAPECLKLQINPTLLILS